MYTQQITHSHVHAYIQTSSISILAHVSQHRIRAASKRENTRALCVYCFVQWYEAELWGKASKVYNELIHIFIMKVFFLIATLIRYSVLSLLSHLLLLPSALQIEYSETKQLILTEKRMRAAVRVKEFFECIEIRPRICGRLIQMVCVCMPFFVCFKRNTHVFSCVFSLFSHLL